MKCSNQQLYYVTAWICSHCNSDSDCLAGLEYCKREGKDDRYDERYRYPNYAAYVIDTEECFMQAMGMEGDPSWKDHTLNTCQVLRGQNLPFFSPKFCSPSSQRKTLQLG